MELSKEPGETRLQSGIHQNDALGPVDTPSSLEAKSAELDRSIAMMRATLESTTDAILVTDFEGNISLYNRLLLELWDLGKNGEVPKNHRELSKRYSALVINPEIYLSRIAEIYRETQDSSFDTLELKDGRVIERYSRPQMVGTENVGRVWSYRDVTEHRKMEAERIHLLESERAARTEAEKLGSLKDEFLTTLSHELRTPLTAILGWCHIIRRDLEDPEKVLAGIEVIDRNARIQTQLVSDLLDMSRIMEGKMRLDVQRVQLPDVIEAAIDSVRPAAEAKSVKIESVLDPISEPIFGDPSRIQQVIWNLLSNAVKFTPKGGKVQIILCRINSHIEIAVSDTGKGISEEFLPYIFERFRQADSSSARVHGGLGIGLALVKKLVDMHGGKIRVESPGVDQGTNFTVELPLAAAMPRSVDREHPRTSKGIPSIENPDITGLRILVVDDEEDARELVKRLLEECGAQITVCRSADEAIRVTQEKPFDILVSDIGMPDKDGYTLVRELRALGVPLVAIALTAFARTEDRTKALVSGFQGHVSKPVEPLELIATIASLAGHFPQGE